MYFAAVVSHYSSVILSFLQFFSVILGSEVQKIGHLNYKQYLCTGFQQLTAGASHFSNHQIIIKMAYVFLSSVCITLFLVLGALSLYGFLELMQAKFPLGWTCYQHVIVLVLLAVLCFIAAVLFGTQIPDCYVS